MPHRYDSEILARLQTRFGSSIRSRRRGLGYTQEELAWRASLHRTYIADVERGSRNVTLRTLGQLAHALEATVADLLGETSDQPTPGALPAAPLALEEILLIEDSADDADLALRAFRESKVRNPIRHLTDGMAALDHLFGPENRRVRPAALPLLPRLILLDLHLPKVHGLEVLRRLKAERRTRTIPVTVMTVSRRDQDIGECRRLGVDHYLMKPVTAETFSRVALSLSLEWAFLPTTEPSVAAGV